MAKAKKNYNNQFITLTNIILPDYEKICVQEYASGNEEKLIFSKSNDPKIAEILNVIGNKSSENPYENLVEMLKEEIIEIEAFLETMQIKANYETQKEKAQERQTELELDLQQILAGKTTMKSLFTRGTKEENIERLEKSIEAAKKDVANLQFICDIITVILGYVEIDRFKKEKAETYYRLLKQMSMLETEYSKSMQNLWYYVLSNPNFKSN